MISVHRFPRDNCPISIEVIDERIENNQYYYRFRITIVDKMTGIAYEEIVEKLFNYKIISIAYTRRYAVFLLKASNQYLLFLYQLDPSEFDNPEFFQIVKIYKVEDLFEYPQVQFKNDEKYAIVEVINGIATSILEYKIPFSKLEDTI